MIVLTVQFFAALVSGSGDGGLAFAALYDADAEMGTGQGASPSFAERNKAKGRGHKAEIPFAKGVTHGVAGKPAQGTKTPELKSSGSDRVTAFHPPHRQDCRAALPAAAGSVPLGERNWHSGSWKHESYV